MADKKAKKKMSAKVFTIIIGSLLALLLAFSIAFPIISAVHFDSLFRDVFGEAGGGKTSGSTVPGDVDTEYYKSDYTSTDALETDEQAYTRKAGAEGFVLLYESEDAATGLPLKANSKVSLFSASSVDLLAGGTGSGVSTISSDMKTALTEQGFTVNEALWKFYSDNHAKYTRGGGALMYGGDEDWSINEAPIADIPQDAKDEATGTTPVFFFSRTGGEGRDLGRYMGSWTEKAEDQPKHYLEPDSVELEVLDYLNTNFNDIIIVVNTNNAFELGWIKDYENISAVLWAPGAGGDTCRSIADVLSGNITPSGHLVDTFAYDAFSSPAMQNMGDIMMTNGGQQWDNQAAAVFYDEGIYVGYKYYETRYFDAVMEQGNAGSYNYDEVVQYPFGYGLSYTDFEWSDFNMDTSSVATDGNITVSVNVKNTGDVKGKDVVQLYLNAPYTEYDKTNHIEKAAVSLVGFAKTGELAAGADETVEITVNVADFVSYDDVAAKTYILEAGDYNLTAAQDAHEAAKNFLAKSGKTEEGGSTDFVGTWTYEYTDNEGVDKTTYAMSSAGVAITNQFDHAVVDEFTSRDKFLTRNDWEGTFPKVHGNQDAKKESGFSERNGYTYEVEVSNDIKSAMQARDSMNPMTDEEAAAKAGEFGKQGELFLIDARGKAFEDVNWDEYIDLMTPSDIKSMISTAGYKTNNNASINKPRVVDYDGPSGLNEGGTTHSPYSITYPCATNIAASWDRENSRLHGYYVGEDGIKEKTTKYGSHNYTGIISGWYGPAMNIHRTPFAGRNFEYYSEDGFISGEMALSAVKAAADKGVYAYIKHFALNDQEDHRSAVATFANEQSIREIYLKPFQTVIEKRGTQKIMVQEYNAETGAFSKVEKEIPTVAAVMTAFNRVGCVWAGGNYNLLTGVLRKEWGFNGSVITDYDNGGYMDTIQCIKAGGDLKLTTFTTSQFDMNSKATQYYAREAIKHVLYTVVNSNAMNGMAHGVAAASLPFAYYWLIIMAWEVIAAGLIVWGVIAIVRRFRKEKK